MEEETKVEETEVEITSNDAQWYANIVAERREWIQHNQEQIDWHARNLAAANQRMKVLQTWLAEAVEWQKAFEAREAV